MTLEEALEELKASAREYFRQVTARGPTPLIAQAHLKIAARAWAQRDFIARGEAVGPIPPEVLE